MSWITLILIYVFSLSVSLTITSIIVKHEAVIGWFIWIFILEFPPFLPICNGQCLPYCVLCDCYSICHVHLLSVVFIFSCVVSWRQLDEVVWLILLYLGGLWVLRLVAIARVRQLLFTKSANSFISVGNFAIYKFHIMLLRFFGLVIIWSARLCSCLPLLFMNLLRWVIGHVIGQVD